MVLTPALYPLIRACAPAGGRGIAAEAEVKDGKVGRLLGRRGRILWVGAGAEGVSHGAVMDSDPRSPLTCIEYISIPVLDGIAMSALLFVGRGG